MLRVVRIPLLLAPLAVLLAAVSTSAASPVSTTRVSITVWPQGRAPGQPAETATLRCRPAGGSHPTPAAACRQLLGHTGALRPVAHDAPCSRIDDDPQQAVIRGLVRGRRVRASFKRSTSCDVRRWNALRSVFAPLAAPSQAATTSLEVGFWPSPDGPERDATLTCEPAGGTLPNAAEACRRLYQLDSPFAPVPAGTACTQAWGGPAEGSVAGIFRGNKVDASFNRRDGCQIERWDRVAFLFVRA